MRSRTVTLGLMVGVAAWLTVTPALAQAPAAPKEKKLSKDQNQEAEALSKLVDQVVAGKPGPADLTLSWGNDFLKAIEGKTYVPFTLSFDATAVGAPTVALYFRVLERAAATATENRDKKDKDKGAFEGIHFVDLKAAEAGQHRVRRAFAVPPGEYDVLVIVREQAGKGKPAKAGFLKQPVSVPNFWNEELTTSTMIVADRLEPAPPMSQEEQAENPYTLGTTRIIPAVDTKFAKKDELSLVFLIYNPALKASKPDVTVEYSFHQQAAEGEKYFNKTNPQQFNAQTLPPQFDMAAGHQLVAGQSVPLGSFPEGDYRLEVKITDNVSGKNLTRDIKFAVAGS